MGSPEGYYLTSQECSGSTTTNTATATFPATPKLGSLLVAAAFTNTGTGTQSMSGFTKEGEALLVSSGQSVCIWTKRSDGTETGATVSTASGTVAQILAVEISSFGLATQESPANYVEAAVGDIKDHNTTIKKNNSGSSTTHSSAGGYFIRGFPYLGFSACALSGSTTSWSYSQTDGGSSQLFASPTVRLNMATLRGDAVDFSLSQAVESGFTWTLGTARAAGIINVYIPLGVRRRVTGGGVL